MSVLLQDRTMPKDKDKRDDVPVKLDRRVKRAADIVAKYRGISAAEYVSERLRPLVMSDLAEHQASGLSPEGESTPEKKPRRRKEA